MIQIPRISVTIYARKKKNPHMYRQPKNFQNSLKVGGMSKYFSLKKNAESFRPLSNAVQTSPSVCLS